MEKKRFTYRPPKNMFDELERQAEEDGISINSWMNLKLKKIKEKKKK